MSALTDGMAFVLAWEGGYVDDPVDRGGATNMGITQTTYNNWLASKRLPAADVQHLTRDEACDIYRSRYWSRVNGDRLAALCPRLAVVVLDAAVQHGPRWAAITLQRAVGVQVDSEIGPATLAAVKVQASVDPTALLTSYLSRRKAYYCAIINGDPSQNRFRNGWRRRLNALCETVGLGPVWVTT